MLGFFNMKESIDRIREIPKVYRGSVGYFSIPAPQEFIYPNESLLSSFTKIVPEINFDTLSGGYLESAYNLTAKKSVLLSEIKILSQLGGFLVTYRFKSYGENKMAGETL